MLTVAYDHQIFSAQRFGGVSRYFCELAERVPRHVGWRAVVVAPVHFNDHLESSNAQHLGRYLPMRIPHAGPLYRAVNAVIAPLLLPTGAEIMHRTYYARGPRIRGARVVVTVHDMIHELYPQFFRDADHVMRIKRSAVSEADAVICVSQSTAKDLRRLIDVPSQKVFVVPHGVSGAFARARPVAEGEPRHARPYLLYVGQRTGYKNFARLLAAYGASPRLVRDFDLLAFGGAALRPDELAQIESLKSRPGAVRHQTGSDADLALAYAGAHVLAYPSEYEGFGIPLLEAMSAGCPVVCSNVSSIPEVVGDAGEYFDPLDSESIRSAIERVAYDDEYRVRLIERGHRRCMAFSWDRCAAETMDVYRHLLSRDPR